MTPLTAQIAWYLEEYLAARPASHGTIRTYRSELKHLERFALASGCTSAEQLTNDLVRACAVSMMAEGRRALARSDDNRTRSKGSEGAARTMVVATRGLCRALRESRRLPDAPELDGVVAPRVPERLQPRVRPRDLGRLEATLDQRRSRMRTSRFEVSRDSALVAFLMDTGLRSIEVSRLDVEDVDPETGEINVREGKGRKPRCLSIWDAESNHGGETLLRLRVYLAERDARLGARSKRVRALWLGVRGRRLSPNSLRTILRQLSVEASVNGNRPPHAFRRGWFTASYVADPQDLPILAARMGWSERSTEMVRVYTRGAMLDLAVTPRPSIARCFLREGRSR